MDWTDVSKALEANVESSRRLSGGDINDAYRVKLDDGRKVFVKRNGSAPHDMFEAEAHGLEWLRVGPLRIPKVLAIGHEFLALELLEPTTRTKAFDETLGRGLATLHQTHPDSFGLQRDNYIGRLPQSNRQHDDWVSFFREERLLAQIELASIGGSLRHRFDQLFEKLPELVGPAEPPARLHGDLWGGNLHTDEEGEPCLIDPATYGGHREIDLAMMRLFGGFSARVFAAYNEAYPLAPGGEERVPLYQLYPLLVHVNLFGGGYLGAVERALDHYL